MSYRLDDFKPGDRVRWRSPHPHGINYLPWGEAKPRFIRAGDTITIYSINSEDERGTSDKSNGPIIIDHIQGGRRVRCFPHMIEPIGDRLDLLLEGTI